MGANAGYDFDEVMDDPSITVRFEAHDNNHLEFDQPVTIETRQPKHGHLTSQTAKIRGLTFKNKLNKHSISGGPGLMEISNEEQIIEDEDDFDETLDADKAKKKKKSDENNDAASQTTTSMPEPDTEDPTKAITADPTTAQPTLKPSTLSPTTSNPTTADPTTSIPTLFPTTTAMPTEQAPKPTEKTSETTPKAPKPSKLPKTP